MPHFASNAIEKHTNILYTGFCYLLNMLYVDEINYTVEKT